MIVIGVGLEAWCVVWCDDHDGDGSGGDASKMVERWHGGGAMSPLLLYAYKSSLLTTRNKNKKEKNLFKASSMSLASGHSLSYGVSPAPSILVQRACSGDCGCDAVCGSCADEHHEVFKLNLHI